MEFFKNLLNKPISNKETIFTYYLGFESVEIAEDTFNKLDMSLVLLEYNVKVCGRKISRDKLVLDKINYFNPISFKKLLPHSRLFILWYDKNKIITDLEIFDISLELDQLKKDYDYIIEEINNGDAHLLREGDTEFLGASLANGKSEQPFSNKLARNRNFCLKKKYLDFIIRGS